MSCKGKFQARIAHGALACIAQEGAHASIAKAEHSGMKCKGRELMCRLQRVRAHVGIAEGRVQASIGQENEIKPCQLVQVIAVCAEKPLQILLAGMFSLANPPAALQLLQKRISSSVCNPPATATANVCLWHHNQAIVCAESDGLGL